MDTKYIKYEKVVAIHDYIIEKSGGLGGINNSGLIISVLEHIKNDDYYPTFTDKLTHLLFSFVMNHSFSDANKRTSIAVSTYFLSINNYDGDIDTFIQIMEPIVVLLAEGKITKTQLNAIITGILNK